MSKTNSVRRWLVSRENSSQARLLVTASDDITVSDFKEAKALSINHVYELDEMFVIVATMGSELSLWSCDLVRPSATCLMTVDQSPFTEFVLNSGYDGSSALLKEPLVRAAILEPFVRALAEEVEWPNLIDCGPIPLDGTHVLPAVQIRETQGSLFIRSFSDIELADGLKRFFKSLD